MSFSSGFTGCRNRLMSRLIPICERGSFISLLFPHRWNSQRLYECYCSKDERNPPTCATRHLALITKTNDLFLPCQLCSFTFKPLYEGPDILESKGWWRLKFSLKFALECSFRKDLPFSSRFLLKFAPERYFWMLFLKVLPERYFWRFFLKFPSTL